MQDALRLLSNDSEQAAAAKALEIERMRLAYGSSLEGNVRMLALQAKQEKTLQALQGGLTRPELSSQVRARRQTVQKTSDGHPSPKEDVTDAPHHS